MERGLYIAAPEGELLSAKIFKIPLDSITPPLIAATSLTWDCNGGAATNVTDANSQPTNFTYDSMWRPTSAGYAGSIKGDVKRKHNPSVRVEGVFLDIQPLGCGWPGIFAERFR